MLDRAGRVEVAQDCSLPGYPNIFVAGDLAAFEGEDGNSLPGVAQVAMQQGDYVAKHIKRQLKGEATPPFHYVDKGSMATIGRAAAVAEIGSFRMSGFFAWLAWLFVHLLFLVGFTNRVLVFLQWVWNYLTYQRGVRLIVDRSGNGSERQAPAITVESIQIDLDEPKQSLNRALPADQVSAEVP
jgi:NADH dehydrogenase